MKKTTPDIGVSVLDYQLDTVLAEAWPDGVPDSEMRLFKLIPPESREVAVRRIGVLLDVETGRASVNEGAEELGLGRSAFHDLRRRWGASRSIAVAIPHVGRAARKPRLNGDLARRLIETAGATGSPDPVVARAWRLVEKGGDLSNGDLARLLVGECEGAISMPTALNVVRSFRQAGRSRPDALAATYGARLLADVSAVAMLIDLGADVAGAAVACFLVEASAGLILGCWAGSRYDASEGQCAALERGLQFLERNRADRAEGGSSVFRLVLAGPDDADAAIVERLSKIVPPEHVYARGRRRFGGHLISMLGQRIGRLDLRPASTGAHAALPRPTLSYLREPIPSSIADGILRDNAARHNEPILERLEAQGLAGINGTARGIMASSIEPVLSALRDQSYIANRSS